MTLDRNVNANGKGKYALVRLRDIEEGTEAYRLLLELSKLGHVDWGVKGHADEFFVIKLRDVHARAALDAYAKSVFDLANEVDDLDVDRIRELTQWAVAVCALGVRSGASSPWAKEPE